MSPSGSDAPRGRSGGARWLSSAGWVVAAAAIGYAVWAQAGSGGGSSPGLPPTLVRAVAFWVPLAAALGACVLGAIWSSHAYRRREKGSVLWMRNGFLTGIVASLVLAVAAQDRDHFPREWLAAIAAATLASVAGVFAYAALREERRSASGVRPSPRSPDRGGGESGA